MDKDEVYIAFELLLEEIEKAVNMISNEAEKYLRAKDFDMVKTLDEYAEQLKDLREKVKALQGEWQALISEIPFQKEKEQRTPEEQFIMPILESIIELGGRAKVKDVLERVYDKMKNILNSYDEEPLSSKPKEKRWENTAQWAIQDMVEKGLLAKDSPWGIWEITEKGRKYYYEEKKKKGGP
jgi:hypothetical protein